MKSAVLIKSIGPITVHEDGSVVVPIVQVDGKEFSWLMTKEAAAQLAEEILRKT